MSQKAICDSVLRVDVGLERIAVSLIPFDTHTFCSKVSTYLLHD
jgi:hypothetical protein